MIPSRFGMAPIGSNMLSQHKNFTEPTSTIFAMPNNLQSNQKFLSQLIRTADPSLPIQKERENMIVHNGMPKICSISFYPQGNEFFIEPIADYFQKNPTSGISSFFTVPEEPCVIFFECEDPNNLIKYLRFVPKLPDFALSAPQIVNTEKFVQIFCNFNVYSRIRVGGFVQISVPEFNDDYAQVISVDKKNKKCLLKFIPRIDYEKLAEYRFNSQLEINNIMSINYRAPKALFDKEKLKKICNNIEFGTKTIQLDNNTKAELVVWSGKKFYGGFQYKSFHFDTIKTIFPEIPIEEFDIFRKNIYSNEKHIRGFVDNCEHLYSDLTKSSIPPSNSSEVEIINEIKNLEESEKSAPLNFQPVKTPKRKKNFFSVSNDPEVKQRIENSIKNDQLREKKVERKPEPKKEPQNEPKPESTNESKSHSKKESKSATTTVTPPKLLLGSTVTPRYGQYSGIICNVTNNDNNFITAEINDSYVKIPLQEFTLNHLKAEDRKETVDTSVQTSPIESPKPIEKVEHRKHQKKSTLVENTSKQPKDLSSSAVQADFEYDQIPRENNLVMLSTGEEAMIIDENTIILSSTGMKKKVKGDEILQSKVVQDSISVNDSKGDRLNVNEEVKITKGRHAGTFAQIMHIANDSLFVKAGDVISAVKPENTKKLSEDAQKVETEDILGEQIVLLKKGEIASKPMTIQRFDQEGNIFVENTYNDERKPKNFSVKLKNYSAKWKFESEIPVELRFGGSNLKKIHKSKKHD